MPDQPFVGEIMPWGGNFAPVGWLACEGQLLSIVVYDVLFNLIGTTYGGDGVNTFALPDLRGRVQMHSGQGPGLSSHVLGEVAGAEQVTLGASQIPSHSHTATSAPAAATNIPVPNGRIPGGTGSGELSYGSPATSPGSMAPSAVSTTGGNTSHENRQPHLAIFFCIAYEGIFPSPT